MYRTSFVSYRISSTGHYFVTYRISCTGHHSYPTGYPLQDTISSLQDITHRILYVVHRIYPQDVPHRITFYPVGDVLWITNYIL